MSKSIECSVSGFPAENNPIVLGASFWKCFKRSKSGYCNLRASTFNGIAMAMFLKEISCCQ